MRKLVEAPNKKKIWTKAEEDYLQDKWGTLSVKGLAKNLGRSENAIIVRAQRLGCGAHLESDVRISLNQFMEALYGGKNMLGYTSDRLIRNGLPVKWHRVKKNRYTYSELAQELRHSEGAIKRRILDLGIKTRPVRCPPENGRRTKWKPCATW